MYVTIQQNSAAFSYRYIHTSARKKPSSWVSVQFYWGPAICGACTFSTRRCKLIMIVLISNIRKIILSRHTQCHPQDLMHNFIQSTQHVDSTNVLDLDFENAMRIL